MIKAWNTVKQFCKWTDSWARKLYSRIIRRDRSATCKIVELLLIKYLYILLVMLVLNGLWYQGYGSYGVDFVFWKELCASVVFVAASYAFLRYPIKNPLARQLMSCLQAIYYIPLNSAFSLNNTGWGFFLLSNLYFVLLYVAVFFLSGRKLENVQVDMKKSKEGKTLDYHNPLANCAVFIVCMLFIIHKLAYNGLDFSLSIASDGVYENRAAYQEFLTKIGGTLFSYILAIVRYLVAYAVPYYVLSGLLRKKGMATVVGVLCALSMFAVSSEKSKLFMPAVALIIYLMHRGGILKDFDNLLRYGLIVGLCGCLAEHFVLGSDKVFMLLVRREMYVPAWLNTLYFDFFSKNPKIMWSQSTMLLQNVLPSVYDSSVLDLINNTYFRGTIPSPNTGMFADAYMNFGVFGLLIYPALFAAMILFFSKVLKKYGDAIQTLFIVQLTLTLTNVPLLRTDFVLSALLFVVILGVSNGIYERYAVQIDNAIAKIDSKAGNLRIRRKENK